MRMEYLSRTGVVQTTKVEEPAPETGFGFFDASQLHRRSLSPRALTLTTLYPADRHLAARSASKIPREAFASADPRGREGRKAKCNRKKSAGLKDSAMRRTRDRNDFLSGLGVFSQRSRRLKALRG